MQWNFSSDVPIYLQIMAQLEEMIASGLLEPGGRLPSVRELAADAGVNPNTMQKALAELERRDIVFSQRTSGRFVTSDPERLDKLRRELAEKKIRYYLDSMSRLGFSEKEAAELLGDRVSS
ncbi:MAG: GntR family transcriptional regulator [Huintestinicola sp.]